MDVDVRWIGYWLLGISSVVMLHGCGGGDNNALIPNPNTSAKAKPVIASRVDLPSASEVKTTEREPTRRIPLTELLDEVPLPALIENNLPDKTVGDEFSINQLQSELYSIQWSNLDGDHSAPDCPKGSVLKCPSFTRYQLSRDGRILARTWAYLPLSNNWVEIKSFIHAFDQLFDQGQVIGDGRAWQEQAPFVSSWTWNISKDHMRYTLGAADIKVIGTQRAISEIQDANFRKFIPQPKLKAVQWRMELLQGEYLSLRPFGFNPSILEKPKQDPDFNFLGMAKFRRALTKDDAFCFEMNGVSQLLQFEPLRIGAKVFDKAEKCKTPMEPLPLNPKTNMTQLQEGVKTIFDRQVIYLTQMSRPSSGATTSSSQYYWALSNDSKNNPVYGKAYQKGFIQAIPVMFYDATIVQDWLAANSNYKQRDLPR